MKLADRILQTVGLKRIGRKQSAVGSLLSLFNLGQAVWTPRRYDKFAEEGYQKNVVAYSSIREVAKGASSVPWRLYRNRGEKRIEIKDHPLLKLLKRPNPMQGGACFLESVYGFFMISGNAYIEAVGPDNGQPREIYSHRPDRMKIVPGRFGLPQAYEYSVSGQSKKWEADPITGKSAILHIKTFNPLNDWYGMSPIEAASYGIDTHNQAGAWNKALLDNGARPSGAMVSASPLTEEQFKRLKEEVDEQYTSPKNAGKPLLLEAGLDWKEMGLSPKDMDFIKSKYTSARDIALAFGVPPMILGIPGDNTYSNQKEARLALWENTILPLVGFAKDELNNWLVPMFGEDLELACDDDQINALAPRREKVWERIQNAEFLTINEKREAVGYEPVPGGNDIFISAALLPIGFGSETSGKGLEYKLVNDATPEERAREWGIQTRLIASYERAFAEKAARLLDIQAKRSARAYREDGRQGVDISLHNHPGEIEQLLTAHYNTIMPVFGKRVLDGFKAIPGRYEIKDREDFFERFLKEWIAKHTGRKVGLLSKETLNQIIMAIEEGEVEGAGVAEIADMIVEKTGGEAAFKRALTIARTETHSAAMAANDAAAEATGLDIKRSWLSARDERTRISHVAADGQVRGMQEYFDIGGVKLLRPGDPDGPAEEIINCRCVVVYLT